MAAAVAVGSAIFYNQATEAQRNVAVQWEYAVVGASYFPHVNDNPSSLVVGAVSICYFQPSGCRYEEVKGEVIVSKYLQEARLENPAQAENAIKNRAAETAYSRAFAKLGADGWEIVGSPEILPDAYILNARGGFDVRSGSFQPGAGVFFKRVRQN
jgi:hypothetical protein